MQDEKKAIESHFSNENLMKEKERIRFHYLGRF